jgi:hypothetical protein
MCLAPVPQAQGQRASGIGPAPSVPAPSVRHLAGDFRMAPERPENASSVMGAVKSPAMIRALLGDIVPGRADAAAGYSMRPLADSLPISRYSRWMARSRCSWAMTMSSWAARKAARMALLRM